MFPLWNNANSNIIFANLAFALGGCILGIDRIFIGNFWQRVVGLVVTPLSLLFLALNIAYLLRPVERGKD
jgi:hypothetical protein